MPWDNEFGGVSMKQNQKCLIYAEIGGLIFLTVQMYMREENLKNLR